MEAAVDREVDAGHARALRLHLEEATVYAFEFRPVAPSGPA